MNLQEIRCALLAITKIEFLYTEPETELQRIGKGMVGVKSKRDSSLVFHEKGVWHKKGSEAKLNFSNTYLWEFTSESLSLSHLRMGEEAPVKLLSFIESGGLWTASNSHQCGNDLYSGALDFLSSEIRLRWSVVGSHKNYHLEICYS